MIKQRKWTYQVKLLFGFTKREGISDRKLSKILGIHYMTIHYWRIKKSEPSIIVRRIIRDYLIKNL